MFWKSVQKDHLEVPDAHDLSCCPWHIPGEDKGGDTEAVTTVAKGRARKLPYDASTSHPQSTFQNFAANHI